MTTTTTRTMAEKITLRSDVCSAIYTADADDLDVFIDAIKRRHKSIREDRATAVMVGAHVRTVNLSPKALDGLTGTVTAIVGKRATITIDDAHLPALRRTRHGWNAPLLDGIPLTALEVL